MSIKLFHRLLSFEETIKLVLEKVDLQPKGIEEVELNDALLRVLARDIYSPINYPPFDRADVDGYAIRSIDSNNATELNPVQLETIGFIKTGESSAGYECRENTAVHVSTGSIVPRGCDSVIMEEYTERYDNYVKIYRSISPGENISTTGSDISAGDYVLPKGLLLRHEHIALLAGLGFSKIPVYVKPKIIVYSTGIEVTKPGMLLEEGKIYDTNGYLISSYLREIGADAVYGGVLPDNYDTIKDTIVKNLEEYDVVVTSGGTSAGESDLVYRVFEELGEIIVHGVKSKPGKPTVIGISKNKLLIGLPGFPLSCYMILIRIVKPIITRLTGLMFTTEKIQAKIPFKIRKDIGKALLIPSILVETPNGYVAYPVSLSSGSIYAITYSDGFIEISEDIDVIEANTLVSFYTFSERAFKRRLVIIGSNDPLLENILSKSGLMYSAKILNTGSMSGWLAVKRGEADIAPTHLLDQETNKYNTPFLDKYGLRGKALVIRGYDRQIGFILAKNNPKNISGFEDFFRRDIRIINRPRGSGIRTLIDINLQRISKEKNIDWVNIPRLINGYTYEVKTHTAVALAIKQGRADIGVAVGYVAELYDLDFIPIGWEEYDFLIPLEKIDKNEVKEFIGILRRGSYLGGDFKFNKYYRIPYNTGYPREEYY